MDILKLMLSLSLFLFSSLSVFILVLINKNTYIEYIIIVVSLRTRKNVLTIELNILWYYSIILLQTVHMVLRASYSFTEKDFSNLLPIYILINVATGTRKI